jgi:hypothetical protein
MNDRSPTTGIGRLTRASLAHFVLAFVTGLPLASASALVPHPDDERGPFVGV